jgi:hypothetical protein
VYKFRYLLFGHDIYYPTGGLNDFEFGFNTLEEFEIYINNIKNFYERYHVVDLTTLYRKDFKHNNFQTACSIIQRRMIKAMRKLIEYNEQFEKTESK